MQERKEPVEVRVFRFGFTGIRFSHTLHQEIDEAY